MVTFTEEIQKKFKNDAEQSIKAKIAEEGFNETQLGKNWMVNHPEVCKDWPPQYIIGKQVTDAKRPVALYEDEFCKLELMELQCEWNYSNPTGMFNLSLPDKLYRMPNYTHISYKQYKQMMAENKHQEEQRAAGVQEPTQAPPVEIDVRNWIESRVQGPVLLQLWLTSKYQSQLQFEV